MVTQKKKISILVPCYNEQDVFGIMIDRLNKLAESDEMKNYKMEFLLINDGSRDKTLTLMQEEAEKNSRVSYIDLARNYGKEIAMMAGIDNVKADAMVIIDADLQDPPELIPQMIKLWEEGYDDVYARRVSRKGETWLKKWTSKKYYQVLQKSTNVPIQKDTGDFRLLDKKCIEALQQLREQNRNMKALFSWIGFKKKEIEYERDARAAGSTKWKYSKLVGLALDGITSFTTAPLRFATWFGAILSFFAFVFAIIFAVRTLIYGNPVAGWTSTFVAITVIGGIQLLTIGILGEYIGRIFVESKRRPLYYIEQTHYCK
ncbi:MAG: glycosyltransferase family 2 protein [Candidatus Ancillula sp.]|jgi:glycosyltransferase involved in cell wall biosynthesis|nr:glycosyltransferase family 2 protein [Candidatus Ancillula sp.]